MEWLIILALGAVCAGLWRRLERAERRLDTIEQLADLAFERRDADRPPQFEAPLAQHVTVVMAGETRPAPPVEVESPPQGPAAATDEPESAEPAERRRRDFDFEDIFGRRLPIWAGGVALAVAGIFLVRYSIERGLITPPLRVAAAFLFGLALLAGAELANRFRERVADPRVAQALAGAGFATLYAGFYLAGARYGLVGQTIAFLGLAAVTAAAIALSFRFGVPSAVLGLVGGFAAPALVGGEDANLPLLSIYLALVTAGLVLSGRQQQRPWLGIFALAGGLSWGALLLLDGDPGVADLAALGLSFIVIGAVLPAMAGAKQFERSLRAVAAAVASIELAILVDQGGYSLLAWGLYLLLAATLALLGWSKPQMRSASALAALVGILLYAQWSAPDSTLFAIVGIGLALIFGGVPLALVQRRVAQPADLLQLALVPAALAAVIYGTFGNVGRDAFEPVLAAATLLLASLPATGAWWAREQPTSPSSLAPLAAALALLYAALLLVTPAWTAPIVALPVLALPAWLARSHPGEAMTKLLWAGAAAMVVALAVTPEFFEELTALAGRTADVSPWRAGLRWCAAAAVFAAIATIEQRAFARSGAEAFAAVLLYGTLAQVLPPDLLPVVAAALAVTLDRGLHGRTAASLALLAIALLWAAAPLGLWVIAGLGSLTGDPVLLADLPSSRTVALRLLPFALAAALVRVPADRGLLSARPLRWLALAVAVIGIHILYKHLFAIGTLVEFVARGMAERCLWQALLAGLALLAWRGLPARRWNHRLALALAVMALAHFTLYTLLLHNPLWERQAVGPLPLANLVLPAYALPIALALFIRRDLPGKARIAMDGFVMLIASAGALTLLRQAFAGSILPDSPMTQGEDLLRSLLGILVALAFLAIGSRLDERSWRVGSLVLMLLAVIKVFLFDAAGLEGLLRIASFTALGGSLIGIGWLYTRLLTRRRVTPGPVNP